MTPRMPAAFTFWKLGERLWWDKSMTTFSGVRIVPRSDRQWTAGLSVHILTRPGESAAVNILFFAAVFCVLCVFACGVGPVACLRILRTHIRKERKTRPQRRTASRLETQHTDMTNEQL